MKLKKIINELMNGKKFIYRRCFETKYFGYYIYNKNTGMIEYYEIDHKTLTYYLKEKTSIEMFYANFKTIEYREDVEWKDHTLVVDSDFPTDVIEKWNNLDKSDIECINYCYKNHIPSWYFGLSYDEYINFYIDNPEYAKYLKENK